MNRRSFLRRLVLGAAGLTLAAKLRIDPRPDFPEIQHLTERLTFAILFEIQEAMRRDIGIAMGIPAHWPIEYDSDLPTAAMGQAAMRLRTVDGTPLRTA